jgi:hypothetical protein
MNKDSFGDCPTLKGCPKSSDGGTSAILIDLPHRDMARRRLLTRAIADVLEAFDYLNYFRVIESPCSWRIEIDKYATIRNSDGRSDFLFELRMRHGPSVLLVTDDRDMMVDFSRQYVHAQITGNADIRKIL